MTDLDGGRLRQRAERLRRQLDTRDRHIEDPVLRAAQAELVGIADRLGAEIDQFGKAQAGLDAKRRRLEADRRQAHALFEAAPEACLVTTNEGIIDRVNAVAAELLGDPRPHERAALVLRVIRGDRAAVHALATACASGKTTEPVNISIVRRNQPLVRVEVRCAVVGEDRLLWTLRDVTEEEAARARLEAVIRRERELSEQLRKLDEARTAFLLAASHDLQAPLAAIAGLAGLLVAKPRMAARDRHRMIEQILSSSERLLGDLRDLLALERLHRGDVGLELQSVDIVALIESAAQSIDLGARRLVVDAERAMALIDPVIVRRIIENLLSNAARHTPVGTTVWVRVRTEPDGVLLVVEDDGPGIPEELRGRAFDLFSRDPQSGGGLGVGLALVRQFTELHGGSARVEARRGGGASFHILLPHASEPTDPGNDEPGRFRVD